MSSCSIILSEVWQNMVETTFVSRAGTRDHPPNTYRLTCPSVAVPFVTRLRPVRARVPGLTGPCWGRLHQETSMAETTRLPRAGAALRKAALAYPEAHEDMPWGHHAIKVRGKT